MNSSFLVKFTFACVRAAAKLFLLSISSHALAQDYSRQVQIVEGLNQQLSQTEYTSRISKPQCEGRDYIRPGLTICTYKFADFAYLEIYADDTGVLSMAQYITMIGDDFERVEREGMFIFSLFIWSSLPETEPYARASALLLDLNTKSFQSPAVEVNYLDWSYGIGEIQSCPIGVLMLTARRTRSGTSAIEAIKKIAERECSMLPSGNP